MAKDNEIRIPIKVDGKEIQLTAKEAKKLAKQLDNTGKSAHSADRQLKGAAQASSNTTKNFSKMAQGISGGLVPAYATLAAQIFAVSAVFRFLADAADMRILTEGQKAMGAATGTAFQTITNRVQEATEGILSFKEASQAVAIGTASGLSPTQLEKLGTAANNVSKALGRDLTDSFNRLIRGVTKAEPELLDELGIILRLDDASRKYKEALGISGRELTQFEKSQAVANEVLDQAERKYAKINQILETNQSEIAKFGKAFDDIMNSVKTGIAKIAEPVASFLSKNIGSTIAVLAIFATGILKSLLPSMTEATKNLEKQAKAQQKLADKQRAKAQEMFADMKNLKNKEQRLQADSQAKMQRIGKAAGLTPQEGRSGAAEYLAGNAKSQRAARAATGRALKSAEMQLKSHAKVQTGIFAGMTRKQVMAVRKAYANMNTSTASWVAKTKASVGGVGLFFKATATKMKSVWTGTMLAMTRATQLGARAMNAAMKATMILGIISLVYDMGKGLYDWFAKKVDPAGAAAKQRMEDLKESAKQFAETQATLNKELSTMVEIFSGKTDKGEDLISGFEERTKYAANAVNSADIGATLKKFKELSELQPGEEKTKAYQGLADTFQKLGELTGNSAFLKASKDLMNGGVLDEKEITKAQEKYKQLGAAVTQYQEAQKGANTEIAGILSSVAGTAGPYGNLIKFLDAQAQAAAVMATGTEAGAEAYKQQAAEINSTIELLKGLQTEERNIALVRSKNAIALAKLGIDPTKQSARAQQLFAIREQELTLQQKVNALKAIEYNLSLAIKNESKEEIDLLQSQLSQGYANLDLEMTKLDILKQQNDEYVMMGYNAKAAFESATSSAIKDLITGAEGSFRDSVAKIAQATLDSVAKSVADAMTDDLMTAIFGKKISPQGKIKDAMMEAADYHGRVIASSMGMDTEGNSTVRDIAGTLASGGNSEGGMLADIAGFFSNLFGGGTGNPIGDFFSNLFGAAKGGIIPMAKGGLMSYATGGIAKQPTYMVGEGKNAEAVVPLPDNRSIPVTMTNGSGQKSVTQNQVNMTINANNGSSQKEFSTEQAAALGDAMTKVVQEELMRQQRPGGLLSPY